MKLPSQIQIGPYKFKISNDLATMNSEQVKMGTSLYGVTDFDTQCIVVHPDIVNDRAAETLMHEMLHCVWNATGLTERHDGEEEFIRSISPLLLDILRRNPQVVKFWMEHENV